MATIEYSTTDFKARVQHHLKYTLNSLNDTDNKEGYWKAISLAVNELVVSKLQETRTRHIEQDVREVNYLSLEYLVGRMLSNNLHNLGIYDIAEAAAKELGHNLTDLCEQGSDMALGNGGLGRLAACFLDSLATLDYPATGYGLFYRNGLFKQSFEHGKQVEAPDEWREFGSPWEVCRAESSQIIPIYGHVEHITRADGSVKSVWKPGHQFKGVPWDIPIVGYNSDTVNVLRLWESRAIEAFDWDSFNDGDYLHAMRDNIKAETVSKVLYPKDEHDAGKELRFIQQYFFSACSLKDIIARHENKHGKNQWQAFVKNTAIQLNDTHPAIAIVEFMRILLDEYDLPWQEAWGYSRAVFSYTNHTLLPEALEKWSVKLFERVLPRHLEIIYQINEELLSNEVNRQWPHDFQMRAKLSLIEEGHERMVRMANLSVAGSHKVNGVAEIHSKLVKQDLFPEFDELWPEKLTNVTNGITPRRWLKACNPKLAALLDKHIDGDWAKDLDSLQQLSKLADKAAFQKSFMDIKHDNKVALAKVIKEETGIEVNPNAIFDVQIKRLHEYKRQHLNFLHILTLYHRLLENPSLDVEPRVVIFGAKAAPGYQLAKEIIYAINKAAEKINNDPRIEDKLKVVFLPNYRVSLAEKIIPAADVSEQISTAGKEASGTGNMKLSLNGALTMGTLDGANIEIAEEVGDDNIFIFGNTVEQVKEIKASGYNPYHFYETNKTLGKILDWLDRDFFTPGQPYELSAIKHSLLDGGDPYLVLADYQSYVDAQHALELAYKDKKKWARMAILNTASMGKFNSDRSIQDYVNNIWHLTPCPKKG